MLQIVAEYLEGSVISFVFKQFTFSPLPIITWRDKSDHLITENDKFEFVVDSDNRKLKIKNLVEEDEGMYTCEGSNSVGSGETSIFLDVTCK